MKFFVPSARFEGAKGGYAFRNGDFGVGYYKDLNAPAGAMTGGAEAKSEGLGTKRLRDEDSDGRQRKGLASREATAEELLEERESEAPAITELDETSLRQLLASFEKKVARNELLRVKHGDEPERFMESEFELHQELQALHLVAAYPALYPTLLHSGALTTVLRMVSHENTDVSIAAVSLLQQLFEMDGSEDELDALAELAAAFVGQQGLELIVQNLPRLDESGGEEDSQGVHHTLSILDSLVELDARYATAVLAKTQALPYLLKRAGRKEYDAVKLYVSELLSMLVLAAPALAAQQVIAQEGLLEALLQAVAVFRKKEIRLPEEVECLENLFLALGALLLQRGTHEMFLRMEGLELLLRCLQGQELAALAALSPLHSALLGDRAACVRFVEIGGLKYLFPYLALVTAAAPQHKHRKVIAQRQRSLEESVLCILAQLCLQLGQDLDVSGKRLAHKLISDGHAHLRALCQVFTKHDAQLTRVDQELARRRQTLSEDEDEEADEEDAYLQRLENGLFAMQQVAVVVGFACRVDRSSVPAATAALRSSDERLGLSDVLTALRGLVVSLADEGKGANGVGQSAEADKVPSEADAQAGKLKDRDTCTEWAALLAAQIEEATSKM